MSVKKSLTAITGCLVCLNSIDNVLIPAEESQDIFNTCCSYVKTAININSLIKHLSENNNNLIFCKKCMEYVINLTQVAEQLENLKTQITDLTNRFSDSISKRRRRAVNTENKTQCSKNMAFPIVSVSAQTAKNATVVSSQEEEQLFVPNTSLNKIEYEENSNESMIGVSSINLLSVKVKVERHQNELGISGDIGSEIVNSENNNLFPEEEYLSPNLFCEDDESNDIVNDPLIFNHDDNDDHLGKNDFNSTRGFVMNCDIESEEQIRKSKSPSSIQHQLNNPSIVHEGVQENANFSMKYISPTISHEDKPLRSNRSGTKGHNASNRQFANNHSLKRVKSNYSNVCKCCKKRFSTQAILTRHMKIHTGRRPFKCSLCKSSFLESGTLKRHFMTHTGERPHKCSQCERSFIQGSDLKIHERVHSGIRPFNCLHCEKAFRTAGARSRHQLKVHDLIELN